MNQGERFDQLGRGLPQNPVRYRRYRKEGQKIGWHEWLSAIAGLIFIGVVLTVSIISVIRIIF